MNKDLLSKGRQRSVMLVSLLLLTVAAFAVPAKPGFTRVLTLSDGTTVNATLVGDEHGHFWRGADGKSYQMVAGRNVYQEVNSQDIVKKAHLRKARVYVTGTNLFCLTKYSGYDPEVDTRRATPLTPGVDYSAYPKSIGFVAGVNLTF